MARIPTPIPESFVKSFSDLLSGTVLNVLWKVAISALFVVLIYLLAQMGIFGALVAGALFSSLFQDDVRAFVIDVWQREFWVFRT